MPAQWDKTKKALEREGKKPDAAAAIASATTGYVKKKGGGWKFKASLKEKTEQARKAAIRKAFR